MVIRMVEYDFHFALTNSLTQKGNYGYSLKFPKSIVIYPAKQINLQEYLCCDIIFPDGSTFPYKVPTVQIQNNSLEEIKEKHLTFFISFTLLRFRPNLETLEKTELTQFCKDIIVLLEEEREKGYITYQQCQDYAQLLILAAERVFVNYQSYIEEVYNMIKPVIKLPSEYYNERYNKLEQKYKKAQYENEQKDIRIAEKDGVINLMSEENAKLLEWALAHGYRED